MKHALSLVLFLCCFASIAAPKQEYYELRTYILKDKSQEEKVEKFLQDALLPALHRASIAHVGVFKPVETDTTYGKRIYLLIPYSSLDQFNKVPGSLTKDKQYLAAGKDYLDAAYENPPYARIQSILLKAFT